MISSAKRWGHLAGRVFRRRLVVLSRDDLRVLRVLSVVQEAVDDQLSVCSSK